MRVSVLIFREPAWSNSEAHHTTLTGTGRGTDLRHTYYITSMSLASMSPQP